MDKHSFKFLSKDFIAHKVGETSTTKVNLHELTVIPKNTISKEVTYSRESKMLTLEYTVPNKNSGKWFVHLNGRGRLFDSIESLERYVRVKEKQSKDSHEYGKKLRNKRGTRIRQQQAKAIRFARSSNIKIKMVK